MKFEITILGSSSATPAFNRFPSSQLININERFYLIDCGEGAQIQLNRFGLKRSRIDGIFISHLHGDHYLGLVGLLSSLNLDGRTTPMDIIAPPELQEIIEIHLKHSRTEIKFPINYITTQAEKSEVIYINEDIFVETIILSHRIPCTGFLFKENHKPRNIRKDKLEELQIPVDKIPEIKSGADYLTPNGIVITNSEITLDPPEPRAYAYCSDTVMITSFLDQISGVDVLYHEATFLHDRIERAKETFHTTALQAAEIAKTAKAKKLLIGHFSARYNDLQPLLEEAQSVFEKTFLAVEGETFSL